MLACQFLQSHWWKRSTTPRVWPCVCLRRGGSKHMSLLFPHWGMLFCVLSLVLVKKSFLRFNKTSTQCAMTRRGNNSLSKEKQNQRFPTNSLSAANWLFCFWRASSTRAHFPLQLLQDWMFRNMVYIKLFNCSWLHVNSPPSPLPLPIKPESVGNTDFISTFF